MESRLVWGRVGRNAEGHRRAPCGATLRKRRPVPTGGGVCAHANVARSRWGELSSRGGHSPLRGGPPRWGHSPPWGRPRRWVRAHTARRARAHAQVHEARSTLESSRRPGGHGARRGRSQSERAAAPRCTEGQRCAADVVAWERSYAFPGKDRSADVRTAAVFQRTAGRPGDRPHDAGSALPARSAYCDGRGHPGSAPARRNFFGTSTASHVRRAHVVPRRSARAPSRATPWRGRGQSPHHVGPDCQALSPRSRSQLHGWPRPQAPFGHEENAHGRDPTADDHARRGCTRSTRSTRDP